MRIKVRLEAHRVEERGVRVEWHAKRRGPKGVLAFRADTKERALRMLTAAFYAELAARLLRGEASPPPDERIEWEVTVVEGTFKPARPHVR